MSAHNRLGTTPENLESVTAASFSILAIAWLTFLPRMYVRIWLIRDFGWDDGFIILTILLFTAYAIEVGLGIQAILSVFRIGTLDTFYSALTRIRDAGILYALTSIFVKLSVLCFLFRFHPPLWSKILMISALAAYAVIGLVATGFLVNQCHSSDDIRVVMSNYLRNTCMPWSLIGPLTYTSACTNCFVDWLLVAVPVHLVMHSTMDRSSKFAASALLILGSAGGICSVIRVAYISGLDLSRALFPPVGISRATTAELGFCIITSCLATLRPLYIHVRAKLLNVTSHSLSRDTSTSNAREKSKPHVGPDTGAEAPKSSTKLTDDEHVSKPGILSRLLPRTVHAVPGVGVLSDIMARTNMSTVTSAIFRRIRDEDFALFGADETHTRHNDGGSCLDSRRSPPSRRDQRPGRRRTQRTGGVGMFSTVDLEEGTYYDTGAGTNRHSGGEVSVGEVAGKNDDAAQVVAIKVSSPREVEVHEVADLERQSDSHRLSIRSFEIGQHAAR